MYLFHSPGSFGQDYALKGSLGREGLISRKIKEKALKITKETKQRVKKYFFFYYMESEYETTSPDRMGAKSKYVQKSKQKSLQKKIPSRVQITKVSSNFESNLFVTY